MGLPFFDRLFGGSARERGQSAITPRAPSTTTGRELYVPHLAERLLDEARRSLPAPLIRALPEVHDWVQDLVVRNRGRSIPIPAPIRAELEGYYPAEVLDRTHVIVQRRCPSIPLSQLGVSGLALPDGDLAAGITFLDTYFVKKGEERRASLHFHEQVHVVQWGMLGPDAFVAVYAHGLMKHGYRSSPLEDMAYVLQDRFEANERFEVIPIVRERLDALRLD